MNEAVQGIDSEMIAVIKMERDILEDLCKQASSLGIVSISNYNCPGQLVVAGEKEAVEKVKELALEKGAKKSYSFKYKWTFSYSIIKRSITCFKRKISTRNIS